MNLREQQKAETRSLLIAKATVQFGALGFESASLSGIAEAAGVTTGALYHHFESKQALFETAAEALEAKVQIEVFNLVSSVPPSVALLREIVIATMDVLSDPVMDRMLLHDAPNVFGVDRWRAVEAKYGLGQMTALFAMLVERGQIIRSDPAISAQLLLSMMLEACRIANSASDRKSARKSALEFVLNSVDAQISESSQA